MAAGIGGVVRIVLSLLAVVLLLVSGSSAAYTARTGGAGAPPDCRELRSEAECARSSRRCRWCTSEVLDDMCFGAAEAWRLPQQVFACG
ncbi:unnamed protein product [Spirodela intermedia]|uniref:Uncharacterized protein n=2 Tax=Spirodela intermedia TaxID=51605 RepID=A0A7I8J3X1_SPIIN|nr:unnamed protein product [Spirodela intermedia]CAA6664948.1 unnamed protein product [Spirodela intermedia]CAA7401587.1 unnamed protein product [Spirodela intermedia]